jgi:hypothetical protein
VDLGGELGDEAVRAVGRAGDQEAGMESGEVRHRDGRYLRCLTLVGKACGPSLPLEMGQMRENWLPVTAVRTAASSGW